MLARGDLIAFYPKTKLQKIIAYFDGKYFHIGIYLGNKIVLSQTRFGVKFENLDIEYRNYKYDIFKINTTRKNIEKLIAFLISQAPIVNYDFSGIVNKVLKFVKNNPKKFFCSEFIAWGLYYIGLLPEKLELTPLELTNQKFIVLKNRSKIKN